MCKNIFVFNLKRNIYLWPHSQWRATCHQMGLCIINLVLARTEIIRIENNFADLRVRGRTAGYLSCTFWMGTMSVFVSQYPAREILKKRDNAVGGQWYHTNPNRKVVRVCFNLLRIKYGNALHLLRVTNYKITKWTNYHLKVYFVLVKYKYQLLCKISRSKVCSSYRKRESTTDSVQWTHTPLYPPPPPPLQGFQFHSTRLHAITHWSSSIQSSRESSSSSPEDDQSILIKTSSCNLQFFSELFTTQFENFTWCHRKQSLLKKGVMLKFEKTLLSENFFYNYSVVLTNKL